MNFSSALVVPTCAAIVAVFAEMAGCQAYDRTIYRAFLNDAAADAGSDSGVDARDVVAPPDVVSVADAQDASDTTVLVDAGVDVAPTDDVPTLTDVPMTPDVVAACDASFGSNEVANSGFEMGLLPWDSFVDPSAAATLAVTVTNPHTGANCIEANITSIGPDEYDVQLIHDTLTIDAGRAVHIEAWMRASTSRIVSISLGQSSAPYANYCYGAGAVGTDWTLVSYTCTPSVSDSNTTLAVNLAREVGTVAVDDVSVSELSVCP